MNNKLPSLGKTDRIKEIKQLKTKGQAREIREKRNYARDGSLGAQ